MNKTSMSRNTATCVPIWPHFTECSSACPLRQTLTRQCCYITRGLPFLATTTIKLLWLHFSLMVLMCCLFLIFKFRKVLESNWCTFLTAWVITQSWYFITAIAPCMVSHWWLCSILKTWILLCQRCLYHDVYVWISWHPPSKYYDHFISGQWHWCFGYTSLLMLCFELSIIEWLHNICEVSGIFINRDGGMLWILMVAGLQPLTM